MARARLLRDRAALPVAADRVRLEVLAARLDRAVRVTVVNDLAVRVRRDARFAPVMRRLLRMMLEG